MKILSLKRLIGLGAIGGAVYYARKHGGFKNAWNEIVGKARGAKDDVIGKAHMDTPSTGYSSASRTTSDETGYGYGGSGGIGGGNIRH